MAKRKKNEAKRGKNPGLKARKFSRIKQEFFDIDYVDQLNEKEKRWLSKFQDEWLGANLKEPRFHKSRKRRKQVFDANNKRNVDTYSIARATGRLVFEPKNASTDNYEDELINFIDSKRLDDI